MIDTVLLQNKTFARQSHRNRGVTGGSWSSWVWPPPQQTLSSEYQNFPQIFFLTLGGLKKKMKRLFWCVTYKEDMKIFDAGKGEGFESE